MWWATWKHIMFVNNCRVQDFEKGNPTFTSLNLRPREALVRMRICITANIEWLDMLDMFEG